jgi:hypothetical protein
LIEGEGRGRGRERERERARVLALKNRLEDHWRKIADFNSDLQTHTHTHTHTHTREKKEPKTICIHSVCLPSEFISI